MDNTLYEMLDNMNTLYKCSNVFRWRQMITAACSA